MELTFLFAKILGSYLVLAACGLFVHQRIYLAEFPRFKEKETRLILAVIDTLLGLFIVYTTFNFSSIGAGLVTLAGIITLVRGVVSMLASDSLYAKLVRTFSQRNTLLLKAALSILIGMYLTAFGFNLIG